MQANPWHAHREEVFVVMRQIDTMAESAHREYIALAPNGFACAVGSADFDPFLKREICMEFLSALNRGMTKQQAYEHSKEFGEFTIKVWNEKTSKGRAYINSPHELKRDKCQADSIATALLVMFSGIE